MTKPKRKIRKFRLFRFRLKTLLIFMLLSGLYLGIVIPNQQRAKRESDAILAIKGVSPGAKFLYDYQLDDDGQFAGAAEGNPVPSWIQMVLGEHTFSAVKSISLEEARWMPAEVDLRVQVEAFRDVELLDAGGCFSKMEDLNCLAKMKKLRELTIRRGGAMEMLNGLENCQRLRALKLQGVPADSFEPLGRLSELSKLSITQCYYVESLVEIANHKGLKELEIEGASSLKSLDFISELSELSKLSITRCYEVKSLDFLKSLEKLESLSVGHTHRASFDFGAIQQNRGLTELQLTSFDKLANLHIVGRFPNLKSLQLEYSFQEFDLSDLSGLSDSLKRLDLNCCHGLKTLEGIESLSELEELEINWCSGLSDFDALANLPKLKSLVLKDLPIDYLPKLEDFPELVHLELHGLDIKDLNDLASLKAPKLNRVIIEDCAELADVKGLESLLEIEAVEFKGCAFVEPSSIERLKAVFPQAKVERHGRR